MDALYEKRLIAVQSGLGKTYADSKYEEVLDTDKYTLGIKYNRKQYPDLTDEEFKNVKKNEVPGWFDNYSNFVLNLIKKTNIIKKYKEENQLKHFIKNFIKKLRQKKKQCTGEKVEEKIQKNRSGYMNFDFVIQHFKHTVILDMNTVSRWKIRLTGKYLYVNSKEGNPVIMVGYKYLLEECDIYTLLESYDIVDIKYSDIKNVNLDNCTKKLYFFNVENGGIHTALEWSMLLNKRLLNEGVKPMLIVDSFEQFYDESYEEPLEDYYDEVFQNNVDFDQSVLILAKWPCMNLGEETAVDVNDKILPNIDALIYAPCYFKNCESDESRVILVVKMMSKIRNKESGKVLKDNLLRMIREQDGHLSYHLFLDLENGVMLTGCKTSAEKLD